MATAKQFEDVIAQARNEDKKISLAEIVGRTLKGKVVEIYVGDTFEDIKYDDSTTKIVAVVIGKVIDAYAECLILDCAFADQNTGKLKFGNIIVLNERAIRFLTELDDVGVLRDIFVSTRSGKNIKELLQNK
jgi:hypothetical protein